MSIAIRRLLSDLGPVGVVSLCMAAATAGFYWTAVVPLKERAQLLDTQMERAARRILRSPGDDTSQAAAQLAAFYKFFRRAETVDEWLVRIYAVAQASGLEMRVADYQLADLRYGIDRYRISLPVQGSYVQIRAFLERVLLEVPVLSLDQATFRRKKVNDARIEAELTLTLHMPAQ